ncbi:MAG: glycosyltransferase [Ignavibacteriaceae bacterium]|nr:glycosyltransferase [Ignavibacteriaceae bacterium]
MESALIVFLGNINYDTRVKNFYDSLTAKGVIVSVICFDWIEGDTTFPGKNVKIYKLSKSSPLLFYPKFIFFTIYNLLKFKGNKIFAEDIYTLPLAVIVAKLKRIKVIYDSRELFAFLAGLKNKKMTQRILTFIEEKFIRKTEKIIVTGSMDGVFISERYNLHKEKIIVHRNLPFYTNSEIVKIEDGVKIVLAYQGVLTAGRGLNNLFKALYQNSNYTLEITGSGDSLEKLKNDVSSLNLVDRVKFNGRVNQNLLTGYTKKAHIGTALIENLSLSYYYALPNKLFEFINAGKPVIVSKLPQMVEIIEKYDCGWVVDLEKENDLEELLDHLYNSKSEIEVKSQNCLKAAKTLNWEVEFEKNFEALFGK